jgi:hypothetical protein
MTKTRKQRTPAEIIAEKEAQIQKLRTKAALDMAKTSPEVLCVVEALDGLTSQQREFSKLLGNSPQSCGARRQKHQLWIDEIDAMQTLAEVSQNDYNRAKELLQSLLNDATTAISNDQPFNPETLAIHVGEVMENLNTSVKVAAATEAYNQAREARKAFDQVTENTETQAAS